MVARTCIEGAGAHPPLPSQERRHDVRPRGFTGLLTRKISGDTRGGRLTPWLWLLPALFFVTIFLIYPVIDTFRISFYDARSENFIGLDNYVYIFTTPRLQDAMLNNILWILLFTLSA
jgi:ABC-type sugar transport system permease subunit